MNTDFPVRPSRFDDPDRPLREVFTSYTNNSGWSSPVVVYLLGWVGTTLASGADASAHIAEETKSPARNVPMAIFWSTFVSYCLGWIVSDSCRVYSWRRGSRF
jgi:amino acid transporter